jgi:hypothetical protein
MAGLVLSKAQDSFLLLSNVSYYKKAHSSSLTTEEYKEEDNGFYLERKGEALKDIGPKIKENYKKEKNLLRTPHAESNAGLLTAAENLVKQNFNLLRSTNSKPSKELKTYKEIWEKNYFFLSNLFLGGACVAGLLKYGAYGLSWYLQDPHPEGEKKTFSPSSALLCLLKEGGIFTLAALRSQGDKIHWTISCLRGSLHLYTSYTLFSGPPPLFQEAKPRPQLKPSFQQELHFSFFWLGTIHCSLMAATSSSIEFFLLKSILGIFLVGPTSVLMETGLNYLKKCITAPSPATHSTPKDLLTPPLEPQAT